MTFQGDERRVGEAAEAVHLPEDREHEPRAQRGQGHRLRGDQRKREGARRLADHGNLCVFYDGGGGGGHLLLRPGAFE